MLSIDEATHRRYKTPCAIVSPTDYLASGGGAGNKGGFVALLTPKIDRTQLEGVQVYLRGRFGENASREEPGDHAGQVEDTNA